MKFIAININKNEKNPIKNKVSGLDNLNYIILAKTSLSK